MFRQDPDHIIANGRIQYKWSGSYQDLGRPYRSNYCKKLVPKKRYSSSQFDDLKALQPPACSGPARRPRPAWSCSRYWARNSHCSARSRSYWVRSSLVQSTSYWTEQSRSLKAQSRRGHRSCCSVPSAEPRRSRRSSSTRSSGQGHWVTSTDISNQYFIIILLY